MQGLSLEQRGEIREYLASNDLFRNLDDDTLASVEAELEWVTVKTGEVLLRQGEVGDCLYVLLSGRLRATIERGGEAETTVGDICPGELVGEMSLIVDDRRSATVRALRPSTLVRLTRTGFNRMQKRHSEIMKHVAELVVRRLRHANVATTPGNGHLTIGVLGVGRDLQLSSFVTCLVKALSQIDSTCHVNAAVVDSQVGAGFAESGDSAREFRVTNWLSNQERRHRFVVYEAANDNDSVQSRWTRRVIEQSDRLLIVVPGDQSPDIDSIGRFSSLGTKRSAGRKDIVLLHFESKRTATGTALWMEAIPTEDRYHVWHGYLPDFDRLARILSGFAVGLVLGGGGARSFAHIGVIRALHNANIPIDFVGGTSVGAVIAAQFAMDWEPDQMIEQNRKFFRIFPIHGDYTQTGPPSAVPHRATRLFESLFGESLIEDQWRNFFSICCNLTRGEIVIDRKGRFRDRVEASTALPVLNAPVFNKGEAMVDGAVINNLPADVMKKLCGGRVIAVDVSPRNDLSASTNEFRRLVRSGQQPQGNIPGVHNVIMRTIMLNSLLSADSMRRHIDAYLSPPVEDIEIFDWAAIGDAVEIGYRYASQELRSMLR